MELLTKMPHLSSKRRRGEEPVASTETSGIVSDHIRALHSLDKQYNHLQSIEQSISTYLQELQSEEASLRTALVQSSTSLKEQRQLEKSKKEKEAMARLEEALMGGDSSSDDEDEGGGDGETKTAAV